MTKMPFIKASSSKKCAIHPSLVGFKISLELVFNENGTLYEHQFRAKNRLNERDHTDLKELIEWCVQMSGTNEHPRITHTCPVTISPDYQPFVAILVLTLSMDAAGLVSVSQIFQVIGPSGQPELPAPTSFDDAIYMARTKSEKWWLENNPQPEVDETLPPKTKPVGLDPMRGK